MGDFKIRISVEVVNDTDTAGDGNTSTTLEAVLAEEDSCNIDVVEKVMLRAYREAITETISRHLTEMSERGRNVSRGKQEGL